jgi:NDP-sugar pyrophosphorylase family protein
MTLPVAILAGGLATRLRPLTEQIPKILIEVAGKPFIEHQLDLLKKHGLTEVVLCLGYLGERVKSVLGNGHRLGVKIEYIFDGPTLLGTGGSLVKALPLLGESFFVLYGDTYLDCPYEVIERAFLDSGKSGLMTVFRNKNQWDLSNVHFSDGEILCYDKKKRTPEMEHIDYGLGILKAKVFDHVSKNEVIDLAMVYQKLITKGDLAGYEVNKRFYEIGSPAGLAETEIFLSKEQV